ncbi:hypothetical protein DFJ77DRAFT_505709 [Powellomyces hirtus]|nr:hypothetical protein DFJ77DRAFT_505709 [Powellomyces hirtus]
MGSNSVRNRGGAPKPIPESTAATEWAKQMGIIASIFLMNGAIHAFITNYPMPIPSFCLPAVRVAALVGAIASPAFIAIETCTDNAFIINRIPLLKALGYGSLAGLTWTQLPMIPGATFCVITALTILIETAVLSFRGKVEMNKPMIPS